MRPCLMRFSIVIVVVVAHRAKSTMSYFCAWTIRSSLGMRPFSNLISLLEGLNFSVIIVSLFPSPSPSPFRFLCVSHFQCIPNRYKLVDIGFYSHCIHSVLFYAFVLAHCVCFLVNCFIKQSLFRNFISILQFAHFLLIFNRWRNGTIWKQETPKRNGKCACLSAIWCTTDESFSFFESHTTK